MIPPSPSLSAFITSPTYLSVTTSVTAQKIRDATPKTCSEVASIGCGSPGLKAVWIV